MTFLSDLIGKSVVDVNEAPMGVIEEVITRAQGRISGPRVTAVVVRQDGVSRIYSTLDLYRVTGNQVFMRVSASKVMKHVPAIWEIYLVKDLLGRPVIDFTHAHAGRIHDIKMEWFDGALFLTHIDIGVEEPGTHSNGEREPLPTERRSRRSQVRSLICWKDFELLPVEIEQPSSYEIEPVKQKASLLSETLVATD